MVKVLSSAEWKVADSITSRVKSKTVKYVLFVASPLSTIKKKTQNWLKQIQTDF